MVKLHHIALLLAAFACLASAPAVAQQAASSPAIPSAAPSSDYEAVARIAALEMREKEIAVAREQADLAAQESMARSARNLLAPSWGQVWIAGIGLIGLTLSLFFTAWSLRQTRLALSSQRETAELDMRAYVGADSIERKNFRAGQRPEFIYRVKNFGRTPAYDVNNVVSLKIVPKGGEPNFQSGPLEVGMMINPGGLILCSERLPVLTQEAFDRFTGDDFGDGDSISFALEVQYRTLGKTKTLKVAMVFWGPGAQHSKIINEMSHCD